jgi:hypothetical protein
MRAIGVLLLLFVLTLGANLAPGAALAAPCPQHGDGSAAVEPSGGEAQEQAAHPDMGALTAAASDELAAGTQHPMSHHGAVDGPFCCHVAAAVAPAPVPEVGPHGGSTRIAQRSWLPPRAAPTTDIYRPPALA